MGRRSMTLEEMRTVNSANPFRPFVIHLADGRELPVRHPEFLLLPPVGRVMHVYQPDGSASHVDVRLVTELEFRSRRRRRSA